MLSRVDSNWLWIMRTTLSGIWLPLDSIRFLNLFQTCSSPRISSRRSPIPASSLGLVLEGAVRFRSFWSCNWKWHIISYRESAFASHTGESLDQWGRFLLWDGGSGPRFAFIFQAPFNWLLHAKKHTWCITNPVWLSFCCVSSTNFFLKH